VVLGIAVKRSSHVPRLVLVAVAAAALAAPSSASAGTALSISADVPAGHESGGVVGVGEHLVAGLNITQILTLADSEATARINLIRLVPSCGPGPSPGNPSSIGPAINTPEDPCSNPDLKVYKGFSSTAQGKLECANTTFKVTGPDSRGRLDFKPSAPVLLQNDQTCRIKFALSVNRRPGKDTFPDRAGRQTVGVAAARSAVILNPGNPNGNNLQAAAMGSSEAVLVKPSHGGRPKLKLPVAKSCVKGKFGARVTGKMISKVAFRLNGKLLKVDRGAPFRVFVSPRALDVGANNLSAKVSFVHSANKAPVKLSGLVFRCKAPSFTG
jgi:hypothetical protein